MSDNTDQSPATTENAAQEKLSAGKRSLACDEYQQAVEHLAVACQLLAEKFGEQSTELADPYFYYGKSLLELARMENGVLGNALDGVTPEEENEAELSESEQFEKANGMPEEERDDVRNKVYSAMSAEEKENKFSDTEADKAGESGVSDSEKDKSTAETESNTVTESTSDKVESTDKAEETSEEKTDAEAGETASEEVTGDEEMATDDGEEGETEEGAEDEAEAVTSSQDEEEDADDVPNLQLAWEVLELSKKTYLSMMESSETVDKAVQEKLSEVYRTLGEVSLESSSYDQATLDLSSCLALQKECFESDNRFLAETHYQLGNCHLLNREYTDAIEHLNKAKSVLELRCTNIEKRLTQELSDQEKEKSEKELQELKQLLPDVVAKIEDADDECRNAERAEAEVKAVISKQQENGGTTTIGFGDAGESTTPVSTIATKKANDISNLIRKRKPEEQASEEDAKKAKTESATGSEGNKENGISSTGEGTEVASA